MAVDRLKVRSRLGFDVAADLRFPPVAADTIGVSIFCHGFSGTKYSHLAEGLAATGFIALSIDFPGYGDTLPGTGRVLPSEQITVVREFGEYADERFCASGSLPIVLVGASLGGAVALNAALGNDRFKAFVLAHPLASGEAFLRRRYPDAASYAAFWERVNDAERRGGMLLRSEIARLPSSLEAYLPGDTAMEFIPRFARDFAAISAVDAIGEVAPRPVLVIHPEGDSMITTDEVRTLVGRGRDNVELRLLEGGEHFILDAPRVVQLTCGWLASKVKDLRSQ